MSEKDAVRSDHDLWRAVRWPLLISAIAGVGIGVATVLDRRWLSPDGRRRRYLRQAVVA